MAFTFGFFEDAAMTTPLVGNLVLSQQSGVSTDIDTVVYFGSTTASKKVEAASDPGVDQVSVTVVDASPGAGHEAVDFKLAATSGGLGAGGQVLNLGTQVVSQLAKEVHIRWNNSVASVGNSTEIKLQCNALIENAV